MYFIYSKTNLKYRIANGFNGEYLHFDDSLTEGLKDFQYWVKECDLTQNLMWYANVFDVVSGDHLGKITILPDGGVKYEAVEKSKIEMGSYTIGQLIKYLI